MHSANSLIAKGDIGVEHAIFDIDKTLIPEIRIASIKNTTTQAIEQLFYHDHHAFRTALETDKKYDLSCDYDFIPESKRNYLHEQIQYAIKHNLCLPTFDILKQKIIRGESFDIITDRPTSQNHMYEAFAQLTAHILQAEKTDKKYRGKNINRKDITKYIDGCYLFAVENDYFPKIIDNYTSKAKRDLHKKVIALEYIIAHRKKNKQDFTIGYYDDRVDILDAMKNIDTHKNIHLHLFQT